MILYVNRWIDIYRYTQYVKIFVYPSNIYVIVVAYKRDKDIREKTEL